MITLQLDYPHIVVTVTDDSVTDSLGNSYTRLSDDEDESLWQTEHIGNVIEVNVTKQPKRFAVITIRQGDAGSMLICPC
jgi:hypothetical protein